MSSFLKLVLGAAKSNTVQFNGIMLVLWTALAQSEFIQSNPEYAAIVGGIQAAINLFLRAKTKAPLSER